MFHSNKGIVFNCLEQIAFSKKGTVIAPAVSFLRTHVHLLGIQYMVFMLSIPVHF